MNLNVAKAPKKILIPRNRSEQHSVQHPAYNGPNDFAFR